MSVRSGHGSGRHVTVCGRLPRRLLREVIVDLDAQVSARQAAGYPPMIKAGVCRHTIAWWRSSGRLTPVGQRGRSPLYRWRDVLEAERDTRLSPLGAPRVSSCRSCDRAAERALVAA